MRKRFRHTAVRLVSCSGKKLVRYAFAAALFVSVFGMCACGKSKADGYSARIVQSDSAAEAMAWKQYCVYTGMYNDTCAVQLRICEKLLDECAEAGILDKRGIKVYKKIAKHPSVEKYIELIEECENESTFYDTVGEGDAWCDYCDFVLTPRGECCGD